MQKLFETRGDLINLANKGHFDVIVHGCNCFCAMGSGIARQVADQIPGAWEADLVTHAGDYNKLGNYSKFTVVTDSLTKYTVINAYTQYTIRQGSASVFEYCAFDLILQKLAHEFRGARFGFPAIGMDRAGGDRATILRSLERFAGFDTIGSATIVWYDGVDS